MSDTRFKDGYAVNHANKPVRTLTEMLGNLALCDSCGCDSDLGFHSFMDIADGTEKSVVIRDGSLEVYDNNEAMKTWLKESCLRRESGNPIAGFAEGHLDTFADPFIDGTKITIGDVVYTLTDPFVNEPYNINVDGVVSISSRLVAAITGGAGEGATYGTGTLPHPDVRATNTPEFTVIANEGGSGGESIVTTSTDPAVDWDEPTLTIHASGYFTIGAAFSDGDTVTIGDITYTFESVFTNTPYHIHMFLPVASIIAGLLLSAIEVGGNGTNIGTGTLPHPDVRLHYTISFGRAAIRARVPGIAGNSIATTSSTAGLVWDNPTLTGG